MSVWIWEGVRKMFQGTVRTWGEGGKGVVRMSVGRMRWEGGDLGVGGGERMGERTGGALGVWG